MSDRMNKIVQLISESDGSQKTIEIIDGAFREMGRESGGSVSDKENAAAILFRGYVSTAPGAPDIPFPLWQDIFVDGLSVLREFVESELIDFEKMPSFVEFLKKSDQRVEEWSKDPALFFKIKAWGMSGSGGR